MQRKDAIPFSYEDCQTAGIATEPGCVAVKMAERHGQIGEVVENEDGGDVPEMWNYFTFSEIRDN